MTHFSEFELIARLTQSLPSHADVSIGVGDDCAILDTGASTLLLATCDSQVEGTHFTFQTSSPEDIGRKALAVNLSDIAAMGGEPRYALISLILPPHLQHDILERIYTGLRQQAEQFATAIVGGNITGTGKGDQFIIDITLLGIVERGQALTRSGAQVGDIVFVTGPLGDSAAGLYTLLHPELEYPQKERDILSAIHRTPHPRIAEGRILSRLGPAIVTSLIDISDGLSGDLGHICERSHVGVRIEVAQLPLSSALRTIAVATSLDPFAWALHGGEDYELLLTVSPSNKLVVTEAVQSATGTTLTAIGTVTPPDAGMKLVWADGHEEDLVGRSWDHLRS